MAYVQSEEAYLQVYNEDTQHAPKDVLTKIGIAFIMSGLMGYKIDSTFF